MVFAKNEDGGILPQSRRAQRNAAIANGYAEANKNYQAYSEDLKVLEKLNEQLDNNGQAITDNEQRMAKANETTKNASQRAKDYGKQIATNAKTLTDFKRENEVKEPEQQKQGKWSDGLKSMASAGLSMIGNAFISAGVGMLVQGAFSLLGKGIDAFVHKNENLIAKGQEAKESIQSQTKAYEDQKASLGELTSKYTELSKGVKISGNSIKNISLTDDEYKDFLDTSNQIAAAAPSLTRSWDSQGNAILNAGTNAEDLNTQVNDYLKLQRNLTYYDTKKNISDQYKGYETALGTNKGKRDEYKNAYDAAKYKVDSVQKFSDMLKKHTKGEDTITYTLDQTAYDALGNTFGKAIKGYKQSADGQKITLEFDGKQLDFLNSEAASVLNSDNSELQEAHTNLVNTQESIDASKREMVSSIKSMASTIDSFDSWDDQDKASEFQSQLNSMLSSSDGTRLLDNFEQSGKDMDTWLRNNVVNPMATATPDQQKLWSQLFEMEPKDQETVREFAARRDDVLESIADISQSDFWTIVNADIMAMYKTLNSMKSRADLIAGDVDVFWANTMNLKTLKAQVDKISEVEQELVDSYFTEENSHSIVDENGNETGNRALNDDIKDKIIPEIQEGLQKIYDKTCELDVEMIPEESLKKMLKSNEDKLSMLDMTVLYEFVEKGE